GGHVLQGESTPEVVLHALDAFGDVAKDRLRKGKWYEVVEIATVDAGPAQVIGNDRRLEALDQGLELVQVALQQRIRAPNVERDAVEDDRKPFALVRQNAQRSPARHHVVLAQSFEEIDAEGSWLPLRENAGVVLGA